jgi:segregation and condensation protein A
MLRSMHSRSALICTFLALLELVRIQAILLRQDRLFGDIILKKHVNFDNAYGDKLAVHDDWR